MEHEKEREKKLNNFQIHIAIYDLNSSYIESAYHLAIIKTFVNYEFSEVYYLSYKTSYMRSK